MKMTVTAHVDIATKLSLGVSVKADTVYLAVMMLSGSMKNAMVCIFHKNTYVGHQFCVNVSL